MRSPIRYYGGKGYLFKKIIALFPPHHTYVEPFGGAAWVLLNKLPSPVEVYNDKNGELVNLFQVLREQGHELQRLLQLTPYARREFVECLGNDGEDDPIERARKTFTKFRQSFGGVRPTPGRWSYAKRQSHFGMAGTTSKWLSMIDSELPNIIERLRAVQIENLDVLDSIDRYDTLETLFYLDPPYLPETRTDRSSFEHEMSFDEHSELLDTVLTVKGKVVLSGYPSSLYADKLKHWESVAIEMPCWSDGHIKFGESRKRRTEIIWLNPAALALHEGSTQ